MEAAQKDSPAPRSSTWVDYSAPKVERQAHLRRSVMVTDIRVFWTDPEIESAVGAIASRRRRRMGAGSRVPCCMTVIVELGTWAAEVRRASRLLTAPGPRCCGPPRKRGVERRSGVCGVSIDRRW